MQYIRATPSVIETLDGHTLLQVSNDAVFLPAVPTLSINQIAGLYWVYRNMPSQYWDVEVIEQVEERISKLLRQEISMQKLLDKDH